MHDDWPKEHQIHSTRVRAARLQRHRLASVACELRSGCLEQPGDRRRAAGAAPWRGGRAGVLPPAGGDHSLSGAAMHSIYVQRPARCCRRRPAKTSGGTCRAYSRLPRPQHVLRPKARTHARAQAMQIVRMSIGAKKGTRGRGGRVRRRPPGAGGGRGACV